MKRLLVSFMPEGTPRYGVPRHFHAVIVEDVKVGVGRSDERLAAVT